MLDWGWENKTGKGRNGAGNQITNAKKIYNDCMDTSFKLKLTFVKNNVNKAMVFGLNNIR